MRYIGYLDDGEAVIGAVSGDEVRRLATIEEFYADPHGCQPTGAPVPLLEASQVPPVPVTAKVLCLGLNYAAHIAETAGTRPPAPNIFARWYSSLSCDGAEVSVPSGEPGLDWECELAVVVGRSMVDADAAEAEAGVLGYTCFNDISGRTYQKRTSQWALGKNVDRSGPMGPAVVTADELGDPYGLRIETRLNGTTMQSSTTDRMIFRIAETIAYVTGCITLHPGDVIATGTPDGVGWRRNPPLFMQAGDTVEVEIERIGVLSTHIV